jgi:hypothetical protein
VKEIKILQRWASQPAQIEGEGLDKGSITGVSLNNYVNSAGTDFYNARRTVNGIDNASAIAGYAQSFATSLYKAAARKGW